MKRLPSCKHPTQILFIDDEPDFLMSIAANLSPQVATYVFYDTPERALSFLNNEYKPDPFTQRSVVNTNTYHYEHHSLKVNLSELYKEIYNPNRFHQISTVIVDYDMPGINGLEVCQQITNPNIQKILLTGAADEHLAVEAFNKGLIHKYIRKQNKDIFEHLEQVIQESQHHYFCQLSSVMATALNNSQEAPDALSDPTFVEAFNTLIAKHKIVEYYQFERLGSFILSDAAGKQYGLFTYNEDRMEADFLEVQDEPTDDVPQSAKDAIQKREKMLCYFKENSSMLPPLNTWEQHLYSATPLQGNAQYYIACESKPIQLDTSRILSFNAFKQEQPQLEQALI